ncbi:hypothetical protein [Lachnoanaerobaculum umeaense]|uniref:hypothetical protein n=1 Tax=Lachnoanaerobaculum umeaense TaxID=617123 RepID=UPI000DB242A2|nr:hypothetical protein [Lachnoanaerobaculum umeaense]PZW97424.1 hypothetical protein C7439_10938 [Lachnoanaerobaculum umeaense]
MGRGGKLDGMVLGGGKRVTAKEYLRQLKTLDNMINAKLLERERIQALATKVTVSNSERVQSGGGSGFENVVIKINELEDEINADIDKLWSLKQEARHLIDLLEDEKHKWVLRERYVEFKSLRWLSEFTGLTIDGVRSLLKRAGKKFNTIYSKSA